MLTLLTKKFGIMVRSGNRGNRAKNVSKGSNMSKLATCIGSLIKTLKL